MSSMNVGSNFGSSPYAEGSAVGDTSKCDMVLPVLLACVVLLVLLTWSTFIYSLFNPVTDTIKSIIWGSLFVNIVLVIGFVLSLKYCNSNIQQSPSTNILF
jgi:hypothetical protein